MNEPNAASQPAQVSSGYRVLVEAVDPVFGFGPYRGRQVSWVAHHDIDYLRQLLTLPLFRQSRLYRVVLEHVLATVKPEDLA